MKTSIALTDVVQRSAVALGVLTALFLALAFGQSVSAGHNADGLVGYWNFDEGSGTDAFDSSSHSLDGTISGATYTGSGPSVAGNVDSLSFDGVDDAVVVADDDKLSFGDGSTDVPFSISAWVYMDDTDFPIVSKFDGSPNNEYFFTVSSDGRLVFVLYDENGPDHIGLASPVGSENGQVGSWTHYAATYDGSSASGGGSMKIYRNGVELATTSIDAGSYTAMHNTGTDVEIGQTVGGVVNRHADGLIDEVRLYSNELSSDEVAALSDYSNFSISLEPEEDINLVGESHTVTATLDPALAGIPILFEVSGANSDGDTASTSGDGEAEFSYTGNTAGVDTITACIDLDGEGDCDEDEPSVEATKYWIDQYAKISGRIDNPDNDEKGAKGKGKGEPLYTFDGFAGDAGGTAVGEVTINYKELGEVCTFTPGEFSLDDAPGIGVNDLLRGDLDNWSNSCGGTARILLLDRDATSTYPRGAIYVDGTIDDNKYGIDIDPDTNSGPGNWHPIDAGNIHVKDLSI